MAVLTKEIADQLIATQGADIVIPDIYTLIEESAFAGKEIASVVIPDSVTSIRTGAFAFNSELTSVILAMASPQLGIVPSNFVD